MKKFIVMLLALRAGAFMRRRFCRGACDSLERRFG